MSGCVGMQKEWIYSPRPAPFYRRLFKNCRSNFNRITSPARPFGHDKDTNILTHINVNKTFFDIKLHDHLPAFVEPFFGLFHVEF